MQKTIIAPVVAVLVLIVQLAFGVQIPEETVNEIIFVAGNVVAVGVTLYGIFKNHKKEGK